MNNMLNNKGNELEKILTQKSIYSGRGNESVNLLKAISCIIVVFMHCRFPGAFGSLIAYIFRFPVSIFFMISGYYCFHKDCIWIKEKSFYILRLYLLSELFYGTFNILINAAFRSVMPLEYLSQIVSTRSIIRVVFSEPLFCGPLWYLNSMFWTWVVLYIALIHEGKESWEQLFILIPVLFTVALVGRRIWSNDSNIWLYRNALLYGLPFVLLGAYMHYQQDKKTKVSDRKACMFIFISGVLIVAEYLAEPVIHDFQFSTIMMSIGLFTLALNHPTLPIKLSFLLHVGAHLSLWIYLGHVAFRTLVDTLALNKGLDSNVWFLWSRPIIILFLTIIFSQCMYIIQKSRTKYD